MRDKHHLWVFYVLLRDCVIRDSLLSTDPALMEWFRRGVANTQKCHRLMRRGFVDVTVCNIFAKTQNKEIKVDFLLLLLLLPQLTWFWSLWHSNTHGQSVPCVTQGCFTIRTDSFFKNKHANSSSSERSRATTGGQSWHYSTLYQETQV